MVDKTSKISQRRQCKLLSIHRSSLYYKPKSESALNLHLMKIIDRQYTMSAQWCVAAIKEAFLLHGKPDIFNTDQGSQFTSDLYVDLLNEQAVQISMPACRPAGTAKEEPSIIFLSKDFGEATSTNIFISALLTEA